MSLVSQLTSTFTQIANDIKGILAKTSFITITQSVNLDDVDDDITILAPFVSTPLTTVELTQLQNINTAVVSSNQWGYLGNTSAFAGTYLAATTVGATQTILQITPSADIGDTATNFLTAYNAIKES